MKQKIIVKFFLLTSMLMHSYTGFTRANEDLSDREMQRTTEFSYHAGPEDSKETAFALAVYGAKHQAVLLSAGDLASRGLLNEFGDRKVAVFCLLAEELQFSIIDKSISEKSNSYTAKIRSTISLSDFVKAEIRNDALEKKDLHLSLKDELDPVVSSTIEPARELSKAYRYLGTQHWRMALIYLDRLEKKYPYWGELFLAKASGFQGMHEIDKVKEALSSACILRNHEACVQLEALQQAN